MFLSSFCFFQRRAITGGPSSPAKGPSYVTQSMYTYLKFYRRIVLIDVLTSVPHVRYGYTSNFIHVQTLPMCIRSGTWPQGGRLPLNLPWAPGIFVRLVLTPRHPIPGCTGTAQASNLFGGKMSE